MNGQTNKELGTCEKSQYEHAGPHVRIGEHGQSMPPFACVNWLPSSPGGESARIERDKLVELIAQKGHEIDFKGSPMLNSDQNSYERSQNAAAWRDVMAEPLADAILLAQPPAEGWVTVTPETMPPTDDLIETVDMRATFPSKTVELRSMNHTDLYVLREYHDEIPFTHWRLVKLPEPPAAEEAPAEGAPPQ